MAKYDNIQETFGITPLEAMAAGLPVIVSDWDGYRDTVRDGQDGFCITTYAPAPGAGPAIARAFEAGTLNYDYLLYRTCMAVSVDMPMLVERLTALVADPELRRRLGETGRRRARDDYDWGHIYRRYQALWDELSAIRTREYEGNRDYWDRAPRSAPGHRDPFEVFAGFPTRTLGPRALVERTEAGSAEAYNALESHPLFSHWRVAPAVITAIFERLGTGPATMGDLQAVSTLDMPLTVEVVGRLAKMNLVRPL